MQNNKDYAGLGVLPELYLLEGKLYSAEDAYYYLSSLGFNDTEVCDYMTSLEKVMLG